MRLKRNIANVLDNIMYVVTTMAFIFMLVVGTLMLFGIDLI